MGRFLGRLEIRLGSRELVEYRSIVFIRSWHYLALASPEDTKPMGYVHATRRITANHAFGPPSLKVKPSRSDRVSILTG
jgi:hypothetical protein